MNDDNLNDTVTGSDFGRGKTTIVPFKPKLVPAEVTVAPADPDVIKMLEFYLAQARAGKIRFAAIAFVGEDGAAASTWAPDQFPNPRETTQAIGAVAYLNARFNQSAVDCENPNGDQWTD